MKELASLNHFFNRYRKQFIPGVLFVILANLFNVFPAPVVRVAFDLVSENISLFNNTQGFLIQSGLYNFFGQILLWFGLIVILLALIRGLFLYLMRQTIIVMSRLIEYDMKNDIYEHYQVLSTSFYRKHNTGDLMARATEDVSRVRMYLGPAVMYTINAVVGFVLFTAIMFSVNIELTLYTVLPMPVLVILIYYVNSIINRRSEEIQTQLSKLSTFVQETFSGIRVIKSFLREKSFMSDFAAESGIYKDKSLGLAKVQALFFPTMLFLIGLSTTLTVYIGGLQVSRGEISAGTIPEFILYINQLTMPITALGWVTSLIQRAAASQKRINEFLYTPSEVKSGSLPAPAITGRLEFRNVSFTYPETGIDALRSISFKIGPGDVLAVIGRTGSGKSTLARLISRLFDPQSGSVLIDDIDIKEYRLGEIRSSVAFVPQEVFLFSDTLEGNIAFALDSFQEKDVLQAARDSAVYDNIMAFPDGFKTMVGERGITLSGGQKQRVSIARALIKKAPILVLDDCLSAVDTHTEEEILAALSQNMKNKTAVIISHRVSSIKDASQIIVLDEGRIVEYGDHSSLINAKGAYFELYEKQLLEEEV